MKIYQCYSQESKAWLVCSKSEYYRYHRQCPDIYRAKSNTMTQKQKFTLTRCIDFIREAESELNNLAEETDGQAEAKINDALIKLSAAIDYLEEASI